MSDRLFDIDDVPEVPLFKPPRRSRGENDARFRNDYPPEWHRCVACDCCFPARPVSGWAA